MNCPKCDGEGRIDGERFGAEGRHITFTKVCDSCEGKGELEDRCEWCDEECDESVRFCSEECENEAEQERQNVRADLLQDILEGK